LKRDSSLPGSKRLKRSCQLSNARRAPAAPLPSTSTVQVAPKQAKVSITTVPS
jgi:hypothetical protein